MKVLVTDNNLGDRVIIQRLLETMGHEAILAESGEEAIARLLQNEPNLILMDIDLPEMDGFETVKEIRGLGLAWLPIIFLSGQTDEQSFTTGIRVGGDDFLYKPINRAIFEAKLIAMERIVNMHRQLLETTSTLELETEKAKQMANIDGLTAIANRRYLDSVALREVSRAAREQVALAVLMIDIDYFKDYNDTFGHIAGDDVLREIASAISQTLNRPADLVARYGGEEFCVILPNTDINGGADIADLLRSAIKSLKIKTSGNHCFDHVTISVGVSSHIPEPGEDAQLLIHLADTALYRAKHEGRNRVCLG